MAHSRPHALVEGGQDGEVTQVNDVGGDPNFRNHNMSANVPDSPSTSRPSSPLVNDHRDHTTTNGLYGEKAGQHIEEKGDELHYQRAVMIIYLIYALVAILSWSFTCVLSKHPIGISTWQDQRGHYSQAQYQTSDQIRRASSVGLNIIFAVGIVTTSAIAARASAAYCQRNSSPKRRALTLRQMLALADKGWANYECLKDVLTPRLSKAITTPLLIFVTSLTTVAFLLPILQAVYVSTKQVKVFTREDRNYSSDNIIGVLMTPAVLTNQDFNRTIQNVIADTVNAKFSDSQPYLWRTQNRTTRMGSLSAIIMEGSQVYGSGYSKYYDLSGYKTLPLDFFSTSLPVGLDTGLIRNFATRLNTSIECRRISQEQFPTEQCDEMAFNRNISNIANASAPNPFYPGEGYLGSQKYRVRICSPGNLTKSPWNITQERQDIYEELWIDYQSSNRPGGPTQDIKFQNYTHHCTSNSTLGFFEVPNYWNGYAVGPLLAEVPRQRLNMTYYTPGFSTPPTLNEEYQVPGPLMMATQAMFGPNTFFDVVTNPENNMVWNYSALEQKLCSQLRYPFAGLLPEGDVNIPSAANLTKWDIPDLWKPCKSRDRGPSNMLFGLLRYMPQFAPPENIMAALTLTMYSVHRHLFTRMPQTHSRPPIAAADGTSYNKIELSVTGMIIITMLLAYQLCGLGYLAFYAYKRPVWTGTLDAKAILKIGAEIAQTRDVKETIPAGMRLATTHEEMARLLDQTEGWVGRSKGCNELETSQDHDVEAGLVDGEKSKEQDERLVLGGEMPARLRGTGLHRFP